MTQTRYTRKTAVFELVIIGIAALYAFPLYILFTLSLKEPSEAAASPLSIPRSLYLDNYIEAWQRADLGSAIFSSATITVISILLLIAVTSMAGYFIARWTSRMSGILFGTFIIGLIVPFQLALIPLYQLMRDLGLLGSYWSVIIYAIISNIPMSLFLYVAFLRVLSRDYEEAAMMDGASSFRVFWRVVFPLMKPVTGTVVILGAIDVWNAFLVPNLFLSGTERETIPVAIFAFVGEFSAEWHVVFAGLVIGLAPILILYLVMQKTVIQGFAGGLKG